MASGVGLTTDIFSPQATQTLTNLALDGGTSRAAVPTARCGVYAADINNDGVIELPRAVLMASYEDAAAHDALYMLDWYAWSGRDTLSRSATYQSVSDAWSLRIDQSWHDHQRSSPRTGTEPCFLLRIRRGKNPIALFNIYCVTGSSREYYAGRSDLIPSGDRAGRIFRENSGRRPDRHAEDERGGEITARFSLVKQAWNN